MTNSLPIQFVTWYLAKFPAEIAAQARNFMIWCWHYFSIGFFLPRLFSPWHKDISSYGRGFDLARWFHTASWNAVSRVIGAMLRIFFIVSGFAMEVAIAGIFVFLTLLWYALPVLVFYLVFSNV
jgi:hypothetical protein